MKIIVIVVIAMMSVCVKGQGKEDIVKLIQSCKTEVGATDDDLAKLLVHAPAENKAQKCLFSCVMAGANVIKDGKLNRDGYMSFAHAVTGGDPAKMVVAVGIFIECQKLEGDADPCEAAATLGNCFVKAGAKAQIMFL